MPQPTAAAAAAAAAEDGQNVRTVKSLFLDCMKRSSVRGVPRIFNAKSLVQRCLWAAAVLLFFGLLMYNIVRLTIVYLRGDVIMSLTPLNPRPPFPAVTICDASAVSHSAMRQLHMTPREYWHRIRAAASNTRADVEPELLQDLLSPLAYHEQLSRRELLEAAAKDQLVLRESCTIHFRHSQAARRCNVTRTQVPGYFSCSTVHPPASTARVLLHLVLDSETSPVRCNKCIMDHVESLRTGLVVFLHEEETFPIDISDGLRLTPGSQNFVHIKAAKTLLRRFCSSDMPERLRLHHGGRMVSVRYRQDVCSALQRHDLYKAECNCTVECLPSSHLPRGDGTESCFRQSLGDSQELRLDRLRCMRRVQETTQHMCQKPCEFIKFTVAPSESKAVNTNSALDFFARYVANTTVFEHLRERLQPYADALELREAGEFQEAASALSNVTYLQDNVVTLILQFKSSKATQVTENYILGLSAFISQIGGLLSLFSGITVICIAEVAELLWLLLRHVAQERK